MFDREVTINRFLLGYVEKLAESITDAELSQRPAAGGHSPLWILGHLAISPDFAAVPLGLTPTAPKEWLAAFGPGSSDDVPQPERFTKAALLEAIRTGYARLHEPALRADPATLSGPHGIGFFAGTPIVTQADVVALILTSHFGLHLGQLSYWSRQHGRQPLF